VKQATPLAWHRKPAGSRHDASKRRKPGLAVAPSTMREILA
jgi:hypothetical protein